MLKKNKMLCLPTYPPLEGAWNPKRSYIFIWPNNLLIFCYFMDMSVILLHLVIYRQQFFLNLECYIVYSLGGGSIPSQQIGSYHYSCIMNSTHQLE